MTLVTQNEPRRVCASRLWWCPRCGMMMFALPAGAEAEGAADSELEEAGASEEAEAAALEEAGALALAATPMGAPET